MFIKSIYFPVTIAKYMSISGNPTLDTIYYIFTRSVHKGIDIFQHHGRRCLERAAKHPAEQPRLVRRNTAGKSEAALATCHN